MWKRIEFDGCNLTQNLLLPEIGCCCCLTCHWSVIVFVQISIDINIIYYDLEQLCSLLNDLYLGKKLGTIECVSLWWI